MSYYTTNLRRLEINITYMCTLRCYNCDRSISVVPGTVKENMSYEQIQKLVKQSVEENYHWEFIRIMGGEPTIHPDFRKIVMELYRYKKEYQPDLLLMVSSNGYTDFTKKELKWVEENYPDIRIENTEKTGNSQFNFCMVHVAPSDFHEEDYVYRGCWVTESAGISLDFTGFYICATGAGIARIFDYDIAIKSVHDLTLENSNKMFNPICSKCGRFHEIREDNDNIEVLLSKSWKKAVKEYDGNYHLTRY